MSRVLISLYAPEFSKLLLTRLVHSNLSSTGRTGRYPGGLGNGSGKVRESTVLVGEDSVPVGDEPDSFEPVGDDVGDEPEDNLPPGVDADSDEEEPDEEEPEGDDSPGGSDGATATRFDGVTGGAAPSTAPGTAPSGCVDANRAAFAVCFAAFAARLASFAFRFSAASASKDSLKIGRAHV